ncbi:TIGR04086 family membrane protein [Bacillota bacterium Meth-B3]|nr:TIGR04086 family membrane protein [Christensenellaceae bacterium]MEA5065628.1 TIGR04086 family membrane protein [Eubacteriales bacterium]MEA5069611.1 TIGR04086 family membrane protein [Christensenellaceae bacterium]
MALDPRGQTALSILKGVLAAMATTIGCMAVLALLVVRMGLSDGALTVLNQIAKVGSIFVGTLVAVGRGGQRGFALGAATGTLYMILGYALYCALDGALVSAGLLAGEFLMGAALGAVSGAVVANLPPRGKHTRRKRTVTRPA